MNRYIEAVGRFGVMLSIMVTMNRTQWYQNLPIQTLTNSSWQIWIFCLGIVLSLIWVLTPLVFTLEKEGEPQC